ncbi:hypothetical protein PVOR_31159 [Paenibacillus vortex V453]|uniref:Uncharacterized protein n=1 Tax=Paenibacillus vortex V453 TaxID=715225 RepID=A0A2R9SLN6_9BACL|nr:hypothetical protein [Paenibacillus vortex]EFU38268.1 hypothetical protein PVOR_31159 [Paenibacillus vortex V453]
MSFRLQKYSVIPSKRVTIYQEKLGELNEQMRMIGLTVGDL